MRHAKPQPPIRFRVPRGAAAGHEFGVVQCPGEHSAEEQIFGDILVVGNEPITLLDIEEMLLVGSYQAVRVVAASSDEFVWDIESDPILVIVDVDSRRSTWVNLAVERVLERRRIPVILLTGFVSEQNQAWAGLANQIRVIEKPFRECDLLRLVSESLALNGDGSW